jgi:hypothetical protein
LDRKGSELRKLVEFKEKAPLSMLFPRWMWDRKQRKLVPVFPVQEFIPPEDNRDFESGEEDI